MSSKKSTVLVIDDDIRMLRMMKRMLELEGFQVTIANNGDMALKSFEKESPDLVILDIMMPDMDGYTVCQRIREFSQVPIIMVTAKGDDKEKVEGLDIGADDYVTKPFSASELAARVRALLRRTGTKYEPQDTIFHYKDLTVDFASRRGMVKDLELKLTSTEDKLLSYISLNAGILCKISDTRSRDYFRRDLYHINLNFYGIGIDDSLNTFGVCICYDCFNFTSSYRRKRRKMDKYLFRTVFF